MQKEFLYKGLTYRFINPCIKQSQKAYVFLHKMLDYAEGFSKESRIDLLAITDKVSKKLKAIEEIAKSLDTKTNSSKFARMKELLQSGKKEEADSFFKYISDESINETEEYRAMLWEFIDAYERYTSKIDLGIRLYVAEDTEAKALFELCLTDADKIDYNKETDEDVAEFEEFRDSVLQGFFFSVQKKRKGLG